MILQGHLISRDCKFVIIIFKLPKLSSLSPSMTKKTNKNKDLEKHEGQEKAGPKDSEIVSCDFCARWCDKTSEEDISAELPAWRKSLHPSRSTAHPDP